MCFAKASATRSISQHFRLPTSLAFVPTGANVASKKVHNMLSESGDRFAS
jgi:hypothetical protein